MATNKKTSLLIDNILPDFVLEDGPKYAAFIRAYYKFLETDGNTTERSKNLLNYADIDTTLSSFLTHFERELSSFLPASSAVNKAFILKNVKDIYQTKGSEESYKILFRLLFNDDVVFDYPGERILRVSDGRWEQRQTIKISPPFTGNPASLFGKITGLTSGATARVLNAIETRELGTQIFELSLNNIEGTFQDGEFIEGEVSLIKGKITSLTGGIRAVEILAGQGGAGHRAGDKVRIISDLGSGANGTVLTTTSESVDFGIVYGGNGYTTNATVTVSGGTGSGASFRVTEVCNTQTLSVYEDVIGDLETANLNVGATFNTYNVATISANLAAANISSTIVEALGTTRFTVGTICKLTIDSRGTGYTALPTATVVQNSNPDIASQEIRAGDGTIYGKNAVISVSRYPGAIGTIKVDSAGAGYYRLNNVTIQNITRETFDELGQPDPDSNPTDDAVGVPSITAISTETGRYTDTKGFISWDNKIQDNYFYQEFSYVVQSQQPLDTYKKTVLNSIHPVGTKLFGEVEITANVDGIVSAETFKVDVIIAEQEKIIPAGITVAASITDGIDIPTVLSFNSNRRFNEQRIDMISIDLVSQHTITIPKTIDQLLVSNNIPTGFVGTSGSQTEGYPYITVT